MAAKKIVKSKEHEARKPVQNNGQSLADFKAKYSPAPASSASVGITGKTYKAPGKSKAYVGPANPQPVKVKTAGQGFAGSGTPLGTSIVGTKTKKSDVAKAAAAITLLPAAAGSAPAAIGANIVGRVMSRYAVPAVVESMSSTMAVAGKGLEKIREGGRLFEASTAIGGPRTLAATKIASKAETAARASNLLKNAENITEAAGRGALRGVTEPMLRDVSKAKQIVKEAAALVVAKNSKPKPKKK
jgi:hypothetical protein